MNSLTKKAFLRHVSRSTNLLKGGLPMLRYVLAAILTISMLSGVAQAAGKTYTVASDGTWPPMEYLDDKKQIMGYSSDYLRAIEKQVNVKFDIRNVAWDGIFAGVAAGNYDIVASSVTITPERQKQFLFSDPYCEIHQALVVPKGSPVKDLKALKGKKVGGQIGTTGIFVMEKANVGAIIREYEDVGLAMQDMANGRIDAVMCDDPVAKYYANKRSDFADKFRVALLTPDVELYGFTVKKGNDDIVKILNEGIKLVKEKGIEKELKIKWMGAE